MFSSSLRQGTSSENPKAASEFFLGLMIVKALISAINRRKALITKERLKRADI
jgi:hypothetical protein